MTTEAQLQIQVADYLRRQYPDVLFHSDYGSGVKLTARQAAVQKRQNGGIKNWPDVFIAESRSLKVMGMKKVAYNGLFLELKREGTRLKKKDGSWATPHIAGQARMLEALRERGYAAEFGVGFDETKRIIDEYFGGR